MTRGDADTGLADAEIDRLTDLIAAASGGKGMSVEWIDGYLAAILCTPTLVRMDDYLPPIFGAASMGELEFEGQEQAQETIALLMRQQNVIASALAKSLTDKQSLHWPILLEDDDGFAPGNEWAQGFLRGATFDPADWAALLEDEEQGGAILPMFALAYENDPDPAIRAAPIKEGKRDDLHVYMTVGLVKAYAYFAQARGAVSMQGVRPGTIVRESPKVGRNEPCPCGSRRKYKHCHGAT